MASARFPILIWQDLQGLYTGKCLDGVYVAALDRTYSGVVDQIKDYLAWRYRNVGGGWPESVSARLVFLKHMARGMYRSGGALAPVEPPILIRVPAVFSSRVDGCTMCTFPTLDQQLFAQSEAAVYRIARECVAESLSGLTPQQLSRQLAPREFELDWIHVKIPTRRPYRGGPDLSVLSSVAEPIGDRRMRRLFPSAWMRTVEVGSVVSSLKDKKSHLLIVGESGSGKTAILVAAIRDREKRDPGHEGGVSRRVSRFWLTSGSRLISGMQYLGQWQERCEEVIEELNTINGVLCVENLIGLLRHGGRSAEDSIAAFFTPYMQSGDLRLVAEVTPKELDAAQRLLPTFTGLFQIVKIENLTKSATRELLGKLADSYQKSERLDVKQEAIDTVLRSHLRFMPYDALPGRCVRFMRRLCADAQAMGMTEVTDDDVVVRFTDETGLPESFLRDDIPLDPVALRNQFQSQVMGQESACRTATHIITRFKAGLNDPARPLGVLLFCGPTGVGKTELAKQMSQYLFGHGERKDRLMRLDMSEYSGYDSANRLITQPDGEPSQLIKRVRSQPFGVILLDEIEKASPDVFDVLLGLFDEGRLTDRFGRTTNFCSTVIIMTSNLGAEASCRLGFDPPEAPDYMRHVRSHFRPEFFNRIDEVVEFQPLDNATIVGITEKELQDLCKREGIAAAKLNLRWTDRLIDFLSREGFDARYGARPLQRVLESRIVAPLAHWISANPGSKGATVCLDASEDGDVSIQTGV